MLLRGELAPSCGQQPVVNPDQLFEFSIGQPGHFAGHIFTPTIRHRALKTADGARPGHRAAHRHRRIAYRAKRRFVTHQLDQRTGQRFAAGSDCTANSDGRQGCAWGRDCWATRLHTTGLGAILERDQPINQTKRAPIVIRSQVAESGPIAMMANLIETGPDHIIIGGQLAVVPGE